MKISITFIILTLVLGCSAKNKPPQKEKQLVSWAIQFADATMTRFDSLVSYNGNKPKYEYDLAFLGSAIDKLGSVNPKYSEYAKAYIDYFVQDDGTITGTNWLITISTGFGRV